MMIFRLKRTFWENTGVFAEGGEVVTGAKNWRKVAAIKAAKDRGEEVTDADIEFAAGGEASVRPNARMAPGGRMSRRHVRPELVIPLIHGSIVIMQGSASQHYYEQRVTVQGKIRFEVSARFVDPGRWKVIEKADKNAQQRSCGKASALLALWIVRLQQIVPLDCCFCHILT